MSHGLMQATPHASRMDFLGRTVRQSLACQLRQASGQTVVCIRRRRRLPMKVGLLLVDALLQGMGLCIQCAGLLLQCGLLRVDASQCLLILGSIGMPGHKLAFLADQFALLRNDLALLLDEPAFLGNELVDGFNLRIPASDLRVFLGHQGIRLLQGCESAGHVGLAVVPKPQQPRIGLVEPFGCVDVVICASDDHVALVEQDNPLPFVDRLREHHELRAAEGSAVG